MFGLDVKKKWAEREKSTILQFVWEPWDGSLNTLLAISNYFVYLNYELSSSFFS